MVARPLSAAFNVPGSNEAMRSFFVTCLIYATGSPRFILTFVDVGWPAVTPAVGWRSMPTARMQRQCN